MRLHLLSLTLAYLLLIAEAALGIAEASWPDANGGPASGATDARMTFGCPATFRGLRSLTGIDGNAGKVRQISNQPTYAFLCRYAGDAGTAEWDVRWDEGNATPATKCGIPDERGTTNPGVPYAFVYSQSKTAFLYVGGRVGTVDEMIALGRPHLLEAEAKAVACKQTAPPKCPAEFNALPFGRLTGNGVVQEVAGGFTYLICRYNSDRLGGVTITVRWLPKPDPMSTPVCGLAAKGTGRREDYTEYSKTKEAFFTVNSSPGVDINVYPATLQEMQAAARTMLTAAEALAAPCAARPGATGGAAAATPAPPVPPSPSTGGTGTDPDVLPDEAYQEPETVSEDGLAGVALEPGSELPSTEEAAAAAAALAAGAAAVGASETTRRRKRESPLGRIPQDVIKAKISAIEEEEARRILRKAFPRSAVDKIDNPVGTLIALTGAAVRPGNLGRTLRQTLVNEPRLTESLLARHGITPPMVAALGGHARVVKLIGQLARNPPKAIATAFKDALHNLSHPKELARHIGNAVKRVVDASPAGPLIRIFRKLFRPRHRGPRAAPAGPQLDASQLAATTPTQLSTTRPETLREEDMYPTAPDSQPGGGP